MPSPAQQLETRDVGHGTYMWKLGAGMQLERPDLKLGPRKTLFEAQVDEQIAKSLVAQKMLVGFCQQLTAFISGAVWTDPGIKKRPNIIEKVQVRGKKIHEVNDVSRATVTFSHIEELYAAEAWVRSRPEFSDMSDFSGSPAKNRYTKSAEDGTYRDIKFFLCFKIPKSHYKWIVELQLNLKVALQHKSIGHGIYEITRLGDNIPRTSPIAVPPSKMLRIARKLRPCYVALKRTGIDQQLLARFLTFIKSGFGAYLDHVDDKDSSFEAGGTTVTVVQRNMLDEVSKAIYIYSFKVAKTAQAYKNCGIQHLIGYEELKN